MRPTTASRSGLVSVYRRWMRKLNRCRVESQTGSLSVNTDMTFDLTAEERISCGTGSAAPGRHPGPCVRGAEPPHTVVRNTITIGDQDHAGGARPDAPPSGGVLQISNDATTGGSNPASGC